MEQAWLLNFLLYWVMITINRLNDLCVQETEHLNQVTEKNQTSLYA